MQLPPAYRPDGPETKPAGSSVVYRPVIIAAVILLAAVLAIYALVDPESPYMPRCMFKMLTGYDCPGCGAQRSLHALLHGHPGEAWSYNPAIFVLLPLLGLYGAVELLRLPARRLRPVLYHPLTLYLLAAAITGWWIARNL